VAAVLPGRTVADVATHYDDLEVDVGSIEAGFVPFPRYGGCGGDRRPPLPRRDSSIGLVFRFALPSTLVVAADPFSAEAPSVLGVVPQFSVFFNRTALANASDMSATTS
jgi:hypothetical protein